MLSSTTRSGAAPADANTPNQVELLVHDSTDTSGEMAYEQITHALDDAKIAHRDYDLASGRDMGDLSLYSGIIFATENIHLLDGHTSMAIDEYVRGGGALTVMMRGWNPLLREAFGIYNHRDPTFIVLKADVNLYEGLLFDLKAQQGEPVMVIPYMLMGDFAALDVLLLDGVKVLAEAEDVPLIWLHEHGKGRVLYWNNDWAVIRPFRGLLVQSVLASHDAAAASMVNAATFDLDDFPLPASMYPQYPTDVEFGMSAADFFAKVWWPDMSYLARRYGVRYTAVIPFNYNATTTPPFDFNEWEWARVDMDEQEDVILTVCMAHRVCAEEHELGLHGYNHQSLMTTHGWTWADADTMALALDGARQRWEEDSLGEMPFSYIAPNNMIGPEGLDALEKAFPSIRVVKGVAMGSSFDIGGNREFGPEPWNDHFFDMPRWSNGYILDNSTRLFILSEIGNLGVWTHFVHPDDVLNNSTNYPGLPPEDLRNPNGMWWRGEQNGMYYTLDEMLAYVEASFPWLRYMTTRDAYGEFEGYLATKVYYDFGNPEEVRVTFDGKPGYFYLRFNDGRRVDMDRVHNAQVVHWYNGDGYTMYVIRATGEEVLLGTFTP